MLIILIRVIFVLLSVAIGYVKADFFTASSLPPWAGAVVGFAIAVTLVAGEHSFRQRFTRSLVAFMIGLAGGLALSMLLIAVLRMVVGAIPGQAGATALDHFELPIALLMTYFVVILVVQNADRLRVIVPFVEFKGERTPEDRAVVDPEALADVRLRGLLDSGVVSVLVVHRSALSIWEQRAASADPVVQSRARRAIAMIAELRDRPNALSVDDSELPAVSDASEAAVRLARLLGTKVIATDAVMVDRCRAEGLSVIHLHALAIALQPQVKPGDRLLVVIAKVGDGRGQGIGFLDDGSMVVVNGAADAIGGEIACTVQRLHATANGRMIFAERCT